MSNAPCMDPGVDADLLRGRGREVDDGLRDEPGMGEKLLRSLHQTETAVLQTHTPGSASAGRSGTSQIAVILGSARKRAGRSPTPPYITDGMDDLTVFDVDPPSSLSKPRIPASAPPKIHSNHERHHDISASHVAPPSTVQQPRKRGRPKGWRAGMPYSQSPKILREKQAIRDPSATPKRRGRRPKPPPPTPRQIYEKLRPPYNTFFCEWEGCPAELHNTETLRNHILLVHGRNHPTRTCKWAKCAKREPPQDFDSHEAFEAHVDGAHLVPFTWHMGDGPANHADCGPRRQDSKSLPAYLFDGQGNQVTPSIRDQEVEDFLTWQKNRKRLKHLLLQRDKNALEEEAYPSSEEEGKGARGG